MQQHTIDYTYLRHQLRVGQVVYALMRRRLDLQLSGLAQVAMMHQGEESFTRFQTLQERWTELLGCYDRRIEGLGQVTRSLDFYLAAQRDGKATPAQAQEILREMGALQLTPGADMAGLEHALRDFQSARDRAHGGASAAGT